jgi:hypothetical protein
MTLGTAMSLLVLVALGMIAAAVVLAVRAEVRLLVARRARRRERSAIHLARLIGELRERFPPTG